MKLVQPLRAFSLLGVIVSVVCGTFELIKHYPYEIYLLHFTQTLVFAVLFFLNVQLERIKSVETILNRAPKPLRWTTVAPAWISLGGAVSLLVVNSLREYHDEFTKASLLSLSILLAICAVFQTALITMVWLIDLELNKPMDSHYDSIILHYLRCLCWSNRIRRFTLFVIPFYIVTLILIVLWVSQLSDDDSCSLNYIFFAACLLGGASLMLSLFLVCCPQSYSRPKKFWCFGGRRTAQLILATLISINLGWGLFGEKLFPPCSYNSNTFHVRVLLVAFGFCLFVLSLTCNLESYIIDYHAYYLGYGLHQMVLNEGSNHSLSYASIGNSDSESNHSMGIEREDSGQPSIIIQ